MIEYSTAEREAERLDAALRRLGLLLPHETLPLPHAVSTGAGGKSRVFHITLDRGEGRIRQLVAKFDREDRAAREWSRMEAFLLDELPMQIPRPLNDRADGVIIYDAANALAAGNPCIGFDEYLHRQLAFNNWHCLKALSRLLSVLSVFYRREPGALRETQRSWGEMMGLAWLGQHDLDALLQKTSIAKKLERRYQADLPNAFEGMARLSRPCGLVMTSRIHGDLHLGNILIAQDQQAAPHDTLVIDLANSEGDRLTAVDLALFETDFWRAVYFPRITATLSPSVALDHFVAVRNRLDDVRGREVEETAIDRATFAFVEALRTYARARLRPGDPQYVLADYFQCLYFCGIRALAFEDSPPMALSAALALRTLTDIEHGLYGEGGRSLRASGALPMQIDGERAYAPIAMHAARKLIETVHGQRTEVKEQERQVLSDPERIYVELELRSDEWDGPPGQNGVALLLEGVTSGRNQLLLADYGRGKSFIATKVMLEQAKRFFADPVHERLPVLFPLTDYHIAERRDSLIDDLWSYLKTRGLPVEEKSDLQALLDGGGLLLIMDGVDEIPLVQSEKDRLALLERLDAGRPCPWIITSRRAELESLVNEARLTSLCRVVEVKAWNEEQWLSYVALCDNLGWFASDSGPGSAERFLERVQNSPRLRALTNTPLYARMLVVTWRRVLETANDVGVAGLYRLYTREVLCSHAYVGDVERDVNVRGAILEAMARYLFATEKPACREQELPEVATFYSEEHDAIAVERVVKTLRTYTLLASEPGGLLRFSHRSLYHYYLARAALHEVTRASGRWSEARLLGSFRQPLDAAALDFLGRILADEHDSALDHLREELCSSRAPIPLRRDLLLVALGAGISLAGANLSDIDLSGCDLRRQDLRKATLDGATANDTDFRDAAMAEVKLRHAKLAGASLAGADLRDADLADAQLTRLRFHDEEPLPFLAGSSLLRIKVHERDRHYIARAVDAHDEDGAWAERARHQLTEAVVIHE